MRKIIVSTLLSCAMAGGYSALAAAAQQTLNLDWQEGAEYFNFPEGTEVKVTELVCPPKATVSVTCRTAAHKRCGSWYLGLNQTAKAGPGGDKGIASMNYNGPVNENCRATIVIQTP